MSDSILNIDDLTTTLSSVEIMSPRDKDNESYISFSPVCDDKSLKVRNESTKRGDLYELIGKNNHLDSIIRKYSKIIETLKLKQLYLEAEKTKFNNLSLHFDKTSIIQKLHKKIINEEVLLFSLKLRLKKQYSNERSKLKLKKFLKKHNILKEQKLNFR